MTKAHTRSARGVQPTRGAATLYLVLFPLIGLVFSSCGTVTSGTRVSLGDSDLAKIQTIGVVVKKEEDFSVRLFRDLGLAGSSAAGPGGEVGFFPGAVLLGAPPQAASPAVSGLQGASVVLGALAVAGAVSYMKELSSKDAQLEVELKPIVGDYDPGKRMGERLRHHLKAGKFLVTVLSSEIEDRKVLKEKKIDGVLQVTLKEWGLRPCMVHGLAGEAQVGVNVHGKLFVLEGGITVWEREELYRDGECYQVDTFRSREDLLNGILTRTIHNLAGKLANEILFP